MLIKTSLPLPPTHHVTGTQFDDLWASLFKMFHDLAPCQSKGARAAAKEIMQDRGLLSVLHRVTVLNISLCKEQRVITNTSQGLEVVFRIKTPEMATAFLRR